MSITNKSMDLFLSTWISSEIIFYLKETSYWFHQDWVSNTKIHKIIYNIAEKYDLPITRSWYIHGAFIHNYDLLQKDFISFVKRYIESKRGPIKYRSKAKKLIENFDEMIIDIHKNASYINSMSAERYLNYLYHYEAPEKYRESYISKNSLYSSNSPIRKIISYGDNYKENISTILELINESYNIITDFEKSVFSLYDDNILEKNVIDYFEFFENVLRKFEISLKKDEPLFPVHFTFFDNLLNNFIFLIWRPYASNITIETVKGARKKRAISNAKNWKRESIKKYPSILESLLSSYLEHNSYLNSYDLVYYVNNKSNNEINYDIINLINSYEKKRN